jgi:hypothetical protein
MTAKEAGQIAHGLIEGYIGPDHCVMDMPSFYGALVQALQAAHQQGWKDQGRSRNPHETLAPSLATRSDALFERRL